MSATMLVRFWIIAGVAGAIVAQTPVVPTIEDKTRGMQRLDSFLPL